MENNLFSLRSFLTSAPFALPHEVDGFLPGTHTENRVDVAHAVVDCSRGNEQRSLGAP